MKNQDTLFNARFFLALIAFVLGVYALLGGSTPALPQEIAEAMK